MICLIYQLKTGYNISMDVKNLVKHAQGIDAYFAPKQNTYALSLRAAADFIRERRAAHGNNADFSRRYILFVPDKYTLLSEKLLYGSGAGSFDTEALTLNRLCFRMAENSGKAMREKPLSRLGAILCVRRILAENADKLGCFKSGARFAGFGEIMYDNISQLAACGISSADLPENERGVLGEKLKAIKFVYSRFEDFTRGKYVDAAGRMRLLEKMIDEDGEYLGSASVAFACFDGFTPLAARIVKKICDICGKDNARIFDADCKLSVAGANIEEYAASSQADELKAAALRMRNLSLSGESYGDMGVIVRDADCNRLKRIFAEYGVPYFTDEKYALSSHPLARYLSDLFAAAKSGTNENYIRLAENPYSGVAPHEADDFETCVLALSMSEGSMSKKFEFGELNDRRLAARLDTAESVRARLHARVAAVKKRDIRGGEDFARAIERAVPPDEPKISAQFCNKFPSAREEILSAVSVIAEVFFGSADYGVMLDSLKECFALREVGVIPNASGVVEVGDVSAFRASCKKYLFVLGMHDGELPAVMHDDGMLSDTDIERIGERAGSRAKIEPSVETLNIRAEEELCSVLSSSENLFLSYRTDCAPSPLLARIRRARKGAKGWSASSLEDERERLCSGNEPNAGELYAMCPTKAAALELYLIGRDDVLAGGDGYGFEPELGKLFANAVPERTARGSAIENARELYYSQRTSVSRVQEYFACPLRHFLRYGLKAKKKPDGKVSPLDLGTFLHRVIELFISGGDYSQPEIAVPAIIEKIKRDEPYSVKGINDAFMRELTAEAIKLCSVAAAQLRAGSFEAEYTEAAFGKPDSPLKGITVTLSCGSTVIEGVIDRLDVASAGEGSRGAARVVDYKTGKAEFDLRDIYYGRKIQLPIYLEVAKANGFLPAGMFYFPFSSGFAEDEKTFRMRGIFDSAYAREMDVRLCEPDYASTVAAARSSKNSSESEIVLNKNSSAAVTRERLSAVCDYALKVFVSGAEEAFSGYCAPSPLVGSNKSECKYCDFAPACTAWGGEKKERRKRRLPLGFFETIQNGGEEKER